MKEERRDGAIWSSQAYKSPGNPEGHAATIFVLDVAEVCPRLEVFMILTGTNGAPGLARPPKRWIRTEAQKIHKSNANMNPHSNLPAYRGYGTKTIHMNISQYFRES